jgi:NADH-quinone oxidoreductase subunit N
MDQPLNMVAALPEILLLVAASMVLLVDVYRREGSALRIDRLATGVLLLPLAATVWQLGQPADLAFNGMYVADSLGHVLKLAAYLAIGATLIYARGYVGARGMDRGEFYALTLFALLGVMVMISANHLLIIYLGLELMSLSLYAMVAMRRDHAISSEAAMKYFVLGALASGFLLYGMSMIYGGTGSLDLREIAQVLAAGEASETVMVFGVVFIVAGLAFKLGAVPFHMWVPDVYQGAPTVATLMIASAPKLAVFAVVFRLLAEGMEVVAFDWQQMLTVLAVLSLALGNVVAIAQTNLKRMLAYSTIGQIGFVLLAMLSGVVDGDAGGAADAYGAGMFYVVTYVLTTLGAFGLIMLLARSGFESEEIDDLRGLSVRSPWMALVMLILMFSLIGIPPTVGFYAKLAVLAAVVNAGAVWLAVVAVLFSLIGAYYYLRVIKVMYFDSPADSTPIEPFADAKAVMAINGALVLLLGIVPGPLMSLCVAAVRQAMAT